MVAWQFWHLIVKSDPQFSGYAFDPPRNLRRHPTIIESRCMKIILTDPKSEITKLER
jgi:hypothetical protein